MKTGLSKVVKIRIIVYMYFFSMMTSNYIKTYLLETYSSITSSLDVFWQDQDSLVHHVGAAIQLTWVCCSGNTIDKNKKYSVRKNKFLCQVMFPISWIISAFLSFVVLMSQFLVIYPSTFNLPPLQYYQANCLGHKSLIYEAADSACGSYSIGIIQSCLI